MLERELQELIHRRLLPGICDKNAIIIKRLSGGANNRIFKIITPYDKYVLKHYFSHKDDQRNRLASDYKFTSFAWKHGIRFVAEPITEDPASATCIYRFIEGKKYRPGDIRDEDITQAMQFCLELNRYGGGTEAAGIAAASEACFSIAEHVSLVDGRVERLKSIDTGDETGKSALAFVKNDLEHIWSDVRNSIMSGSGLAEHLLTKRLQQNETVLSPSDFGFHNAIMGNDNVTRFIDFEYAGWDDPAKMVCDFFNQVAVPVPFKYFEKFSTNIAESVQDTESTLRRIRLLLPLYRIKWCCIVLNHFLPVGSSRRQFAFKDAVDEKKKQLEKAISLLHSINQMQLKGV